LMWPFSISIWICNPVRIYGNKWYDDDDDDDVSVSCAVIKENYYAIYLKPDIVIKLLNVFPRAVML
jgi:hypothetical protein